MGGIISHLNQSLGGAAALGETEKRAHHLHEGSQDRFIPPSGALFHE
jgi:hypothetical protein